MSTRIYRLMNISEHAGPLFSEEGACLFLAKLAVVSQENAGNFTQSVKPRWALVTKTGSSA